MYQQLENYDGPYIDESCDGKLCWILVAADLANFITTQTKWPARLTNQYVVATVSYEVHQNSTGVYTTITAISVTNHTKSPLNLDNILIGKSRLKPLGTILAPMGQSSYYQLSTPNLQGRSSAVNLYFVSPIFQPITLKTHLH